MTRLSQEASFARCATHVVAAVALILQLMLPAAAFAAAGSAGTRVPVCTGVGIVWMDVGTETPASRTGGSGQTTVHCPICFSTAAPALAVAPASVAAPWLAGMVDGAKPVDTVVPRHVGWIPHRSRAPPVSA